jgi:hemerythrin-like metal-binding protein
MSIITWSNMLSVGVSEIDHQHQVLIDLINRLGAVSDLASDSKNQQSVLDEMTCYAGAHFTYEAELMRQIDYVQSPQHLREHSDFVDAVKAMLQRRTLGESLQAQEFLVFLRNWLVNHILSTDRQLGKALNAKGIH